MADAIKGKNTKFNIGTSKVSLMGTWGMTGVTTDILEKTEFGDDWKQFEVGLKDGGQITVSGFYDPTDSSGQDALRTANLNDTEMTTIRLYIDSTSYWTPKTTNPASYCLVTDWDINSDVAGLVSASFTLKVSGALELI